MEVNIQGTSVWVKFYLDKLKDCNGSQMGRGICCAFNCVEYDLNNLVETFNSANQETANNILGKQRYKKQPRISDEVQGLCGKRRKF